MQSLQRIYTKLKPIHIYLLTFLILLLSQGNSEEPDLKHNPVYLPSRLNLKNKTINIELFIYEGEAFRAFGLRNDWEGAKIVLLF